MEFKYLYDTNTGLFQGYMSINTEHLSTQSYTLVPPDYTDVIDVSDTFFKWEGNAWIQLTSQQVSQLGN